VVSSPRSRYNTKDYRDTDSGNQPTISNICSTRWQRVIRIESVGRAPGADHRWFPLRVLRRLLRVLRWRLEEQERRWHIWVLSYHSAGHVVRKRTLMHQEHRQELRRRRAHRTVAHRMPTMEHWETMRCYRL